MPLAEAEQVVVHEHLSVAVGPGADPDRRHREPPRDLGRDRRGNRLEHDGEAACIFERERALALPRALAARDPGALDGLAVDYFEEADFEPRVLAAAVRVGSTRLIDNVVLEGDTE